MLIMARKYTLVRPKSTMLWREEYAKITGELVELYKKGFGMKAIIKMKPHLVGYRVKATLIEAGVFNVGSKGGGGSKGEYRTRVEAAVAEEPKKAINSEIMSAYRDEVSVINRMDGLWFNEFYSKPKYREASRVAALERYRSNREA